MERIICPILSFALFFVTTAVSAMPAGSPQDYSLKTKYTCQANGVSLHSQNKLISSGDTMQDVIYTAAPGKNQSLGLNGRQYMIWPRVTKGSFEKALNVMVKEDSKNYRIVQEMDLGDSQKTKTSINVTVKDKQGEERLVACKVDLEWVKK